MSVLVVGAAESVDNRLRVHSRLGPTHSLLGALELAM